MPAASMASMTAHIKTRKADLPKNSRPSLAGRVQIRWMALSAYSV